MNKQSYNKIAKEFSATRQSAWRDMESLREYYRSGMKILDLGCGNGRLLNLPGLRIRPEDYLGLDFSEGLIGEARRLRPEYEFRLADLTNFRVQREYDILVMIASFNHLNKSEQVKALRAVYSALKKGGILFMLNWNLWNIKNKKSVWRAGKVKNIKSVNTTWQGSRLQANLFYYAFTKRELARLVKKTGFSVIRNEYVSNGKRAGWLTGKNILTIAKK